MLCLSFAAFSDQNALMPFGVPHPAGPLYFL
jgi:hypothetical protein